MQSDCEIPARPVWYVYLHTRPSGEPFYVGKGTSNRAYDFAASRRTQHHRNIVQKYGRANIGIVVIAAMSEFEAFMLEKAHIQIARFAGYQLANYTDGGEGASGREPTAAQLAALAKGRYASKRIPVDGAAKGRAKASAWKKTPEGRQHLARLAENGKAILHRERHVDCRACGIRFVTRSAKAVFCSNRCSQRVRRRARRTS